MELSRRFTKKQKKYLVLVAFGFAMCGVYLGWLSLNELNHTFDPTAMLAGGAGSIVLSDNTDGA